MLWRSAFLLIWLLSCPLLGVDFEEVPEFQPQQLEDNWLQQLTQELGNTSFGLRTRSRIDQQGHEELGLLRIHARGFELNSGFYLPDQEQVKGNFQLACHSPATENAELVVGTYRSAWGMGNLLARQAVNSRASLISNPPHPDRYALSGLSGSLSYQGLSLLGLISRQKRSARLSEGQISSLSSTRQPNLPAVEERVYGLGLQHHGKLCTLGFLAYRQEYDRPFVNVDYRQKLNALSLYGAINGVKVNAQTELSMLGNNPQARMELGYRLPSFSQKLGLIYTQSTQLAAYAARPGLLSARGNRQEYDYQIEAGLLRDVSLGFSTALSRSNDALQPQSWNSRSIISARYQAAVTVLKAQLTILGRELLAETDSSYISTLPVHYRIGISLNRQLSRDVEYQLSMRYHYQEKTNRRENGLWTQNALEWKHQDLSICGGIKVWHSQRSMLLPETDGSGPEGYSLALGEDDRVFVKMGAEYKWLKCGVNLEQSWLDGDRSLLLSLGTNVN